MTAEPVLRYWTLQSPEGHIATCELVRTAAGLEVRCDSTGDAGDAPGVRATAIRAVSDALNLAEAWKAAYLVKGWEPRTARDQPPGT